MTAVEAEEFDLAALVRLLLRRRWLVTAISLLGAVLFGLVAFTTRPYFKAEVVVTDARDRGMGGMSPLAGQLGGLASLAGVNLNPGQLGASQEAAAILDSHHLAEQFIKRNDLLPLLQRANAKERTLWLAVDGFKKDVLSVRKDLRKGVTTVTVVWTDPALAALWANSYVALANEMIRNRAIDESSRNIAYLNEQIAKTDVLELRKVLYNLVENETKTLMVANGRTEYAFEVVDPAVAPDRKAGPHRLILTLVGLVVGFGAACVVAFVVDRLPRRRLAEAVQTRQM